MGSIKKVDFSPTKDWARGLVALHDGAMIIYQTDPLFAWNRLGLTTLLAGAQRREVCRLGQTKLSPIAKVLTRS